LSGRRPTDGVKDGLLKATMLLQHGNRSADDLEQVAGQLAQLAAAKINGEHMGADLTTAVKAIRELVVGMKKATETEVTQTQENIDELHNRILQCKKPSASASVIEDLEEDSEQQGVKHANCQSALKAKQDNLDQCNSLVETLKKSKESLCQAVEDMSPNPGVCEANDGDSYKSWVERLAGYFDTKMKEYEDKEEKCTDAKRDYEGNKSRCGTLQDGVTGKQDTCDAVARELNTKGCLAASTRADVCNQYHCCYTSSTGAYEVAVTNGRQEETAFIAYWTAMAHIECLLDVLVAPDASTDKIDACLSKKIDTTPVELSYPTVPDKEHCEGPSVYPCVPKWMEDHKLKDKSCVPCQGIKDSDSCGTGGDTENPPTSPAPVAANTYHWVVSNSGRYGEECRRDSDITAKGMQRNTNIATLCCPDLTRGPSSDMEERKKSFPCKFSQTWAAAEAECKLVGWTLCSRSQIKRGDVFNFHSKSLGTCTDDGYNFFQNSNQSPVWALDDCSTPVESIYDHAPLPP